MFTPLFQVWSVSSLSTVATLSGHKFGVSCVAFTPGSQYVVSVSALHQIMEIELSLNFMFLDEYVLVAVDIMDYLSTRPGGR